MSSGRSYQVVARRFRPRTFTELVGQEAVVASLSGALESGQVPHAFLFSGSRGVGKTTVARILARALNCEQGPTASPCGVCASCKSILEGHNADVVEIDAASHNLVDDIRELRERVGFASMGSRYKVYILDEVHMLTRSAFNAFLKTLEEPPANVVFVLATTELHKVPETIRSRCQVLLFRRIGEPDIVRRLRTIVDAEGLEITDGVLDEIAQSSRGGMRDSETTLERVLPVAREKDGAFDVEDYRALVHRVGIDRSIAVVGDLVGGNASSALHFADAVVQGGVDEREALGELLEVLRAVLLLKVDGPDTALVTWTGKVREGLVALAESTATERLDAMIQAGLIGRERIRRMDDRRLVLEVSMLRMAQAGALPTLADLVQVAESGGGLQASAPAAAHAPPGAGSDGGALAPGGAPAGGAPGAAAVAAPAGMAAGLVARVKQEVPRLASTLEQCDITEPDAEGRMTVTVKSTKKLHRDRMAAPGVREQLQRFAAEVAGRDVKLAVLDGNAAGPAGGGGSGGDEAPKRAKGPGENAKRALERFEGRVIDDPPKG